MGDLILGLSILLQFSAAGLAFRLMRITQQSRAWGIIAIAISFMAIRRSITGYNVLTSDAVFTLDLYTESVALGISLLMVIGLISIAPFFSTILRSERVIQQSEKRYKTLAKVSPVGIFHTDRDGICLNVNERWCEITGLSMEKAIGNNWGESLHPADKHLVYHTWEEAVQNQNHFQLEYRFQKRDGSTTWVYGQATPEFDESENLVSYVGTITDISERKHTEQEFRGLMESAPDAMVIVDIKGVISRINQQTEAMFGYPRDELIGKNVETLIPLRFRKYHNKNIANFVDNVRIRAMGAGLELYGLRKDGSEFPVEISLGPIETLEETLISAAIRDITDRKKSEHLLKDKEVRIRLLLDSTAEAIYGLDLQGRCTFCNSASLQMLGYENAAQLMGKNMHQLIHHTRKDGSVYTEAECQICQSSIKGKKIHVIEEVLWRADGTSFPAEYWSHPIYQNEKPIGSVVTFLDISERIMAEMELKESEERFRQLAESINQVFWLTDWKTKKLLYVSPAYETIFEKSIESAYQDRKNWLHDIHPDDRERVSSSFAKHAEQGEYVEAEYRLLRHDGAVRWIKDRAFPVFDDQGEVTRIVGIAEDISERKNTEYEKESLEAQLRQSQKLEAIGQLAGGIAHDFNNILTAIIGNAELLLRKSTKQTTIDMAMKTGLDQIDKAAKRAAKLTRQLLTFSRKQVLRAVDFDMNKILKDMKPMLISLLGDAIDLTVLPSSTPATIRADMGQLEQVILNLTLNARDALPEGGQLILKTQIAELDSQIIRDHPNMTPGSYVCLSVSDNGIGMDPVTMERIFEPFFTTKPIGQGTGLGLSTVYGIVEQSGGQIVTTSTPSEGTTFKLYFPAVKQSQYDERHTDHYEFTTARGHETILICEDEVSVLSLTKQTLEDMGYKVLTATHGKQALEIAYKYKGDIDMLLTDAIMPGMNGRELAESLLKYRSNATVLYMSGYSSDILEQALEKPTELAFLQKPFDSQELLKSVRRLLDHKS